MRTTDPLVRWLTAIPTILVCLACAGCSKSGGPKHGVGGAGGKSSSSSGNGGKSGSGGSSAATGDSGAGGVGNNEAPFAAKDLGEGQCLAINGRGQVLGLDADGTFLIDSDGTRTALGSMPDGAAAIGVALGPNGDVVGFSESDSGRKAIRYAAGGWETLEGTGGTWSAAASVGDDGQIVGTVGASDGTVHGFLWQAGKTKALPLDATQSSSALVRGKNAVAGVMQVADATHAFVATDAGKLTDLGTLGGSNSNPFAMNAGGTVVGAAHDEQAIVGAFVWQPGGSLTALGVPKGARASEARGVDSAGHVLGNVIDQSGLAHGVLFDTDQASIRDLPLPADAAGLSFFVARVMAVAPDGTTLGIGSARGGDGSPMRCVVWRPL